MQLFGENYMHGLLYITYLQTVHNVGCLPLLPGTTCGAPDVS